MNWVELLTISALIFFNSFCIAGTWLTIYAIFKLRSIGNKTKDTIDIVQQAAFNIYEGFDKRTSRVTNTLIDVLTSYLKRRRR